MGITKYIELQLVDSLNLINAKLVMKCFDEVEQMLATLRYPTIQPVETINDGIEDIKAFFQKNEYELCSNKIAEIVDKLNRVIFDFKCNKSWFDLTRTIHPNVRFCSSCEKNVYRIENEFDLKKHVQANDCIFYLGEVETPKSCQITEWGEERVISRFGQSHGLMGVPSYNPKIKKK